jgi:hypothetical protein
MNWYLIRYRFADGLRQYWAIGVGASLAQAQRSIQAERYFEAILTGPWRRLKVVPGKRMPFCYPRFHNY